MIRFFMTLWHIVKARTQKTVHFPKHGRHKEATQLESGVAVPIKGDLQDSLCVKIFNC